MDTGGKRIQQEEDHKEAPSNKKPRVWSQPKLMEQHDRVGSSPLSDESVVKLIESLALKM